MNVVLFKKSRVLVLNRAFFEISRVGLYLDRVGEILYRVGGNLHRAGEMFGRAGGIVDGEVEEDDRALEKVTR